jgi:hypothetical protein
MYPVEAVPDVVDADPEGEQRVGAVPMGTGRLVCKVLLEEANLGNNRLHRGKVWCY